jgi:hypothetical protein
MAAPESGQLDLTLQDGGIRYLGVLGFARHEVCSVVHVLRSRCSLIGTCV